jgi:hypothetical protein
MDEKETIFIITIYEFKSRSLISSFNSEIISDLCSDYSMTIGSYKGKGLRKKVATSTQPQLLSNFADFKQTTGFPD